LRLPVPQLAAALTLALLLCAPATALAGIDDSGFDRTFPAAAALCFRAAHGWPPRRLAPYTAGIQATCRELRARYGATQRELDSALDAARALSRAGRRLAESVARDTARHEIEAERRAFWRAIADLPNGQVPPNIPV
jgi:hypothetical protein